MKFWDSSAVVPLLTNQTASEPASSLFRGDPEVVLWWGTPVECASALERLLREGVIQRSDLRQAQDLLDRLREHAYEVQPIDEIRARAQRLLAVHRLRAADSLQLAAALLWCRERPRNVGFVCLDDRLRGAATLEGFTVLPYADEVNGREIPE